MAKAAAKSAPKAKAPSKSEVFAKISEATGVSKKEVTAVFDALNTEISKSLSKKGPGVFQIPGLCKITLVRKPATKDRPGINPFTKEPTTIKGKPAHNKVRIRPLKNLKEMV